MKEPFSGILDVAAFVLILVWFSGIPLGLLAFAFAARTGYRRGQWSSEWSQIFLAGFVFQACSLATALFWLGVVFDLPSLRDELFDGYGFFLVGVIGIIALNVFGLRAWRALRKTVDAGPLRVV